MPNFPMSGMLASRLIEELQSMIEKHGDRQVYLPGYDYPEGCGAIRFVEKGDGYTPTGCFELR